VALRGRRGLYLGSLSSPLAGEVALRGRRGLYLGSLSSLLAGEVALRGRRGRSFREFVLPACRGGGPKGRRGRSYKSGPLAQGPESAVPEDQRVARALDRRLDPADADVMVPGRMGRDQDALEPRHAPLD
jgi:hypothetical protein